MDIEYDENLRNNDLEYERGLEGPEILIPIINENPPTIYNPISFQTELIVQFMQNKGILMANRRCPICLSAMNILKDQNAADKLIWRCQKRKPPHDKKINLRSGSIFEGLIEKIQILYFVTFFCFTENTSLNEALDRCKNFSSQMGQYNISREGIIKIFGILRYKVKEKMHKSWEKNLFGIQINTNLGFPSVELDESKII